MTAGLSDCCVEDGGCLKGVLSVSSCRVGMSDLREAGVRTAGELGRAEALAAVQGLLGTGCSPPACSALVGVDVLDGSAAAGLRLALACFPLAISADGATATDDTGKGTSGETTEEERTSETERGECSEV